VRLPWTRHRTPPVPRTATRPADEPGVDTTSATRIRTRYSPPARPSPDRFWGAGIRLFQADVLLIYVSLQVIVDWLEAPLVVAAFHARFGRTIVLAAQDARGVPTYFGPAAIARVLARIPFDALGWKRYRYARPQPPMLPIPVDPLPAGGSSSFDDPGPFSYLPTKTRDRRQIPTRR